ncbi:hypothetical protein GWI33_007322 [Rhynchophorus ferrugineus]|uniref:MORN repeat-containing protein 5 n=1 Tax=Rhynchophorus ferrugineus TaxID=354439 RepID=A0A834IGE9_RHYFE|nr:hypothetical protein GWI33_007322 [Rhynchophorus ferrugineus]
MSRPRNFFSFDLQTLNESISSKNAEIVGDTIRLDFMNTPQSRRSSFLPSELHSDVKLFGNFQGETMMSTSLYATHVPSKKDTKVQFATFCTGSSYIGDFNTLGMTGKGIYKYPHGVIYEGDFNKNGEFHGAGVLRYPNGHNVEGIWRNGKLVKNPIFVAADNTQYRSQYCKIPDRRFEIEMQQYLAPAPNEFLMNKPNPPRVIPPGCYDAGEGFYDPKRNVLLKYSDLSVLTQVPEVLNESEAKERLLKLVTLTASQKSLLDKLVTQRTESKSNKLTNLPLFLAGNWIIHNCRKAEDDPVGYKPRLYENWTAGFKDDEDYEPPQQTDSASEIDVIIETLNKMETTQDRNQSGSKFYSFIRCDHESTLSEDGSLLALQNMFFTQMLKHCIIKKAKVHWAKQKTKGKRRKSSMRFSKQRVITFNTASTTD